MTEGVALVCPGLTEEGAYCSLGVPAGLDYVAGGLERRGQKLVR